MFWAPLVGFLVLALPSPSLADTVIAGDLDYARPIDSNAGSGGGFGIRLGHQYRAPFLSLTPELAFTYHGFSGGRGLDVYRGLAGLRLGIGEIIRPGVFGHIGAGWPVLNQAEPDGGGARFTYDFGAFLDFTVLPVFNIGVHAAYNHLFGDVGGLSWLTVGPHAALVF
jgi:hypothetical protein